MPTAIVRFLESDTQTKLIAKPQLRGAEGTKLTLNLGEEIPVISTSYTPIATGGAGVNPLSSYQYQDVGVNIDMTPRVTLEGDIILDLTLENSSLRRRHQSSPASRCRRSCSARSRRGCGCATASRTCWPGCCARTSAKTLHGFPGRDSRAVPASSCSRTTTSSIDQTDIVMLLTPHIVRTHEITETDLQPDLHRLAAEPRRRRPAAAHRAARPTRQPPPPRRRRGAAVPRRRHRRHAADPRRARTRRIDADGAARIVAGARHRRSCRRSAASGAAARRRRRACSDAPPPPAATAATPAAGLQRRPPRGRPTTSPGIGSAQVIVSPPGTTFRVGGGPYTVPISITDASRLSTVTLTLTFDPAMLRVRARAGGQLHARRRRDAAFTQQVNGGPRRHHARRAADATGASGTGLLAAVLFDADRARARADADAERHRPPDRAARPMGLQFRPVTVTVQ